MDIVKLLIEKDADVHAKTHGGKTALHGAVVQKRDEVINILLVRPNPTESLARALLKLGLSAALQDAGARTNVPMGSEGVRPYDLAAKTEKKSGLRDITRQRALQLPHSLDALA